MGKADEQINTGTNNSGNTTSQTRKRSHEAEVTDPNTANDTTKRFAGKNYLKKKQQKNTGVKRMKQSNIFEESLINKMTKAMREKEIQF